MAQLKNKIQLLSKHTFVRGGMVFTAATFLSGFINYLFNSFAGKTLGPKGFSEIIALSSYFILLTVPLHTVTTDIIRRLGKGDRDKLVTILRWEAWMWKKINQRKWLGLVLVLLILPLPRITNLSLSSSVTLLLVAALAFPASFYLAALQGIHKFAVFSVLLIAISLTKLAGPIVAFLGGGGIYTVLAFMAFAGVIPIVMGSIYLRRERRSQGLPHGDVEKQLRSVLINRSMIITTVSLLSVTFLINLDVIFVKKFFAADVAGVYGGWNLFAKILYYVLSSLITLSLIFFASEKYKTYHTRVLLLILASFGLFGSAIYAIYLLQGKFIVDLLFTHEYYAMIPILPQAALFGLFYSVIFVVNNYFLARESKLSLLAAVSIPLYFLALYFSRGSLDHVLRADLWGSGLIALAYLGGFFYYNKTA